jgi:hypothetical protein
VDQGSSRSAVAVNEGVNGLKLGVRQRCLHNSRQRVVVAEATEVEKQIVDELR